ncbi:unnamed protein product [Amoebophrya sp. A25]|nr:unnamed protein product [Amoebophrya sp. A25]|eukprot:GSA25T00019851001.1
MAAIAATGKDAYRDGEIPVQQQGDGDGLEETTSSTPSADTRTSVEERLIAQRERLAMLLDEGADAEDGETINLGLKLNQACLRDEYSDGSIFGIDKMRDAGAAVLMSSEAGRKSTARASLWDIARFACEQWQNLVRRILMPMIYVLYPDKTPLWWSTNRAVALNVEQDDVTSSDSNEKPLSKLDKNNIEILVHEYRAHTWESAVVNGEPYNGDLFQYARHIFLQKTSSTDGQGSTSIDSESDSESSAGVGVGGRPNDNEGEQEQGKSKAGARGVIYTGDESSGRIDLLPGIGRDDIAVGGSSDSGLLASESSVASASLGSALREQTPFQREKERLLTSLLVEEDKDGSSGAALGEKINQLPINQLPRLPLQDAASRPCATDLLPVKAIKIVQAADAELTRLRRKYEKLTFESLQEETSTGDELLQEVLEEIQEDGTTDFPFTVPSSAKDLEVLVQIMEIFSDHEDKLSAIRRATSVALPYELNLKEDDHQSGGSGSTQSNKDKETLLLTASGLAGSRSLSGVVTSLVRQSSRFHARFRALNEMRRRATDGRVRQVQELQKFINEKLLDLEERSTSPTERVLLTERLLVDLRTEANVDIQNLVEHFVRPEFDRLDTFSFDFHKEEVSKLRASLREFRGHIVALASRVGNLMDAVAAVYYERLAPLLRKGCEKDICNRNIARAKVEDAKMVYKHNRTTTRTSSNVAETTSDSEEALGGGLATTTSSPTSTLSTKLILPFCPALRRSPGLRMAESHLWPPPLRIPKVFTADLLLYGKALKKNAFYMQKTSSDDWAADLDPENPAYTKSRGATSSQVKSKTSNDEMREETSKWDGNVFEDLLSPNKNRLKPKNAADTIRNRLLENIASGKAVSGDYALDRWTDEDLLFLDRVNETVSSYKRDSVFCLDAVLLRMELNTNSTGGASKQKQRERSTTSTTTIKADHEVQERIGILGSEQPWMEVVLLYRRPNATIITVDYRKPTFTRYPHPRWRFLPFHDLLLREDASTTLDTTNQDENDTLLDVDAWFSFSSIEHAGLGRYGEPLNPWADVQTLALLWCHTREGGYFYLGPNCVDSCGWLAETYQDVVYFNAGRDYGRAGWARLTMSWIADLGKSSPFLDRGKKAKSSAGYVALLKQS